MHMFYYIIRQKWDEINRQMWEISAWGGVGGRNICYTTIIRATVRIHKKKIIRCLRFFFKKYF